MNKQNFLVLSFVGLSHRIHVTGCWFLIDGLYQSNRPFQWANPEAILWSLAVSAREPVTSSVKRKPAGVLRERLTWILLRVKCQCMWECRMYWRFFSLHPVLLPKAVAVLIIGSQHKVQSWHSVWSEHAGMSLSPGLYFWLPDPVLRLLLKLL